MCRLLGYVTGEPRAVTASLGAEAFTSFTSLASLHGDGWGAAWQDPETGRTRVVTSPESAATDQEFADLTSTPLGRGGMVHLRWATEGLAISPENTHPFQDGEFAFGHNGGITPINALEGLLTEESRAALRGTTDSERYFRYLLQTLQGAEDEPAALTEAVSTLARHFPRSSLNALLLTSTALYAIHVNSDANPPTEDMWKLYESEEEMPVGHLNQYFAMFHRRRGNEIHVISSGLTEPGWEPVPPDSILTIDLVSAHTRTLPLRTAALN
ncbi:MAG: class II glutamine amidotransferase [Propionibacteriaceae bacterium]